MTDDRLADARVELQVLRDEVRFTKANLTLCDEYVRRGEPPPYDMAEREKHLRQLIVDRDAQEDLVQKLGGSPSAGPVVPHG